MRARAGEEIEAWWQERRQQDSEAVEAGRQAGFEEGYRSGAEQGEREMKAQWESRLAEARDIVTQAYAARERIIAEAEQFLVQLSCSIAEKIIQTRLAETPAVALDMIASALARRKEQGVITLCVSPAQFAFVNAAKDELLPAVDPQASLQIVPDPAVKDGGCIIRSAFGSIDARVDTQLAAIREELVRAAAQAGEERGPDVADA